MMWQQVVMDGTKQTVLPFRMILTQTYQGSFGCLFSYWVINPISLSVSKYQQYAQRIPILRCSVALKGRIDAGSC
ncbi:hypothetical protein DBR09_20665 [Aeromonas sp. HMWF016]|nr:hypothetical protein DBR09_20665 [Aeromonas sp. HMWF016]